MPLNKTTISAFSDEFSKIAAGHAVRSGRRPISVDRYLEKERDVEGVSDLIDDSTDGILESPETTKEAALSKTHKNIALMAAGAGAYHLGRKANEDRRLGRAVRLQSQQGQ